MDCPSDAELLAFTKGHLPAAARATAEAHLDTCPTCLAVVAALARATASGLRASPRAGSPEPSLPFPDPVLEDGEPRYVPGDEIARGGMGRIVAAEDRLLRRRVALKRLKRPDAALLARFLRERRVTARLQHPAIVPVYDAGTFQGGEPYFVMRLVSGERLDVVADKARSMEERLRLVPAVISVVDAVAYAHGEGVIHRDLKPQNVLVGAFGEVVVLDWGLARELDGGDEEEPDGGARDADPVATRDGEVLGTLAYMAPEQAAGRAVDARADVYGLGAILYHVLAGAPPHVGRPASLSAGAVRHAPEPLAERAPEVPPDLATIVERAMAMDPADRYASARELDEELRRWQAGQSVKAHRYGVGDVVRRFVRRHRAAVLVGLAAFVSLIAVSSVGLRRVLVERARAEAERIRAEASRDRADAHRVAAESLVEFMLGDLRDRLEQMGRLDVLEGAARAVGAYQDRAPPAEDPAAWLRISKAAGLVGDVSLAVGDFGAAEAAYRRSRQAAEQGASAKEADEARCRAEHRLGNLSKERGALDAAARAYEACAAIAAGHEDAALRELFITSHLFLADVAERRDDLAGSRRILEDQLGHAEALAREAGVGSEVARVVVRLRDTLAKNLELAGEARAFHDVAGAALAFAEARAAARPGDMQARSDVGDAHLAVATAGCFIGAPADAEKADLSALAVFRDLTAFDPTNVRWQRSAAAALDGLGWAMMARRDPKAALSWFRESEAISAKLASLNPRSLQCQRDLALVTSEVGSVLLELQRLDEARERMKRAIEIAEQGAQRFPDAHDRLEHDLATMLNTLGTLELRAKAQPAARAALSRSVDILRRSVASSDSPRTRRELAGTLLLLAKTEEGGAVCQHRGEARALLEPLRATSAADPQVASDIKDVDDAWALCAPRAALSAPAPGRAGQ